MSAQNVRVFAGVAALLAAAAAHATLYEFTLSGDAAVSLNDIIDRPAQNTRLTLSVIADPGASTLRFTNSPGIEAIDARYDTAAFSARSVNDPTAPNGLYEYFMPDGQAMLLKPDVSSFTTTGLVPVDWLGVIDPVVFTGGIARSWTPNPNPAPVSLPLPVWPGQGPVPLGTLYAVPTSVRVTVEGGGPLCCMLLYRWTGNAVFTAAPIVPEPGTLVTIALGIIAVILRARPGAASVSIVP